MKNKISNAITILCVLLCLLTLYLGYCAVFAHREKPKSANKNIEFEYAFVQQPVNWKEQLQKLINTPHKVYWTEIERGDIAGYTNLVSRKIYLDLDMEQYFEVYVYAHELIHLKEFTINETYTTYKAIITLYESDNAYFKYVALKNANNIINNHSYKNTDYDCGYLLQQYFEGKEIFK